MALTRKQQQFVAEYIKDFNATQAAIRAGYSERSAYSSGQRLLCNAEITDAIQQIQTEQRDAAIMEYDEACVILSDIARGKLADYMDDDGRVQTALIKQRHPHAVQSIEHNMKIEGSNEDPEYIHVTKLKLHSPMQAIEKLAKLKNWEPPQRHDINLKKSFAELVLEARAEEARRDGDDSG